MKEGRLYVISGPSGVGKGTIVNKIMETADRVSLSVSATTRNPREGEKEGVSYYFLSDEEFKKKIKAGGFLEYAGVHGHYYGTPKAPVEAELKKGRDVILEIDVQGAMKVKETGALPGTWIFILPPSMDELRSRIIGRGTESEEDIKLRLGKAMAEMEYLPRYDYYVINDDLNEAVSTVINIMKIEHHRIDAGAEKILNSYRG